MLPRTLMIAAFALLSTACSAKAVGPPDIAVDRTACSHCGMYVSEPAYAAAYQAPGEDARIFDDIGCMLEAVRSETASPITIWLQDAEGSGWVAADDAALVTSPQFRTPMNGGMLAYANPAAAAETARAHRGRVLRLQELMKINGDPR